MAKSKTRELERLKKLLKDGDISEDEFQEMRKELMSSSKTKDDDGGCLGILILAAIGYGIYAIFF